MTALMLLCLVNSTEILMLVSGDIIATVIFGDILYMCSTVTSILNDNNKSCISIQQCLMRYPVVDDIINPLKINFVMTRGLKYVDFVN